MVLRNRDVKLAKWKKIEEKSDLHSLCSLSGGNGDTMYEYIQARCGGVEGYRAQRTTRRLVVMRNTTEQLHNVKFFALDCCVVSHILWQVVNIGDSDLNLSKKIYLIETFDHKISIFDPIFFEKIDL